MSNPQIAERSTVLPEANGKHVEEFPEDFNFNLEPRCWKFSIAGRRCVLREASEKGHTQSRNVSLRNLVFTGDQNEKKGSFVGGAEADTVLLSQCLYEIIPSVNKETGVPIVVDGVPQFVERLIPLQQIETLPRWLTSRLYNWLRKNSGIEEETETAEFLIKRIEADQKKLAAIQGKGTAGKDGQNSTLNTSG